MAICRPARALRSAPIGGPPASRSRMIRSAGEQSASSCGRPATIAAAAELPDWGWVAGGRPSRRSNWASAMSLTAGVQVDGPPSQPGRVRPEHLPDGAHRVQPVRSAPDQRPVGQPVHRGRHVGGQLRDEPVPHPAQRGVRAGAHHHLQDAQGEGVQAVQGPGDRGADAGPAGQHGEVHRRRQGKVRTPAQQRHQLAVGPAAQPLGQGMGRAGACRSLRLRRHTGPAFEAIRAQRPARCGRLSGPGWR